MPDQGDHDVMVRSGSERCAARNRQDKGPEGAGECRWLSENYVA